MNSDSHDHAPLSSMTVNERLYKEGLLARFDAAVRKRELVTMIELLREAQISDADANSIAAAMLSDPARFGY